MLELTWVFTFEVNNWKKSTLPSSFLSHSSFLAFSLLQHADVLFPINSNRVEEGLFQCSWSILHVYVCPFKHPHLPRLYHHWNQCATMGKINFLIRDPPLQLRASHLPTCLCPVTASISATRDTQKHILSPYSIYQQPFLLWLVHFCS